MLNVTVDPDDYDSIIDLIKTAPGQSGIGTNENGEDVLVEVNNDNVCVTTFQHNHWIRLNYYYTDGTVEELYDGKWS